jgi:arginine-tRNA-protein transferase
MDTTTTSVETNRHQTVNNNRSIAFLTGENSHSCGYCKSGADSSVSFGFMTERIQAEEYEQLMLRGWRRSGTYFYKPLNHTTCCPIYSIRLRANSFQPSKSQKKVLKQAITLTTNNTSTSSTIETSGIVIETEPSAYSEEKFLLYQRYQVAVHHDKPEEVTPKSFTNFLVNSPLYSNNKHPVLDLFYGSYHQLYRLNGQLIAVGVLDFLPSGVSSVYCFYDPDYRHLALGKYSALKEIEYCRRYNFEYYYMGYYIHNCEKMRYKGDYHPSELLCPRTLHWVPLKDCIVILERFEFSPLVEPFLSERAALTNDDVNGKEQFTFPLPLDAKAIVESLPINLISLGMTVRLGQLAVRGQDILRPLLTTWVQLAGEEISRAMIVGIS